MQLQYLPLPVTEHSQKAVQGVAQLFPNQFLMGLLCLDILQKQSQISILIPCRRIQAAHLRTQLQKLTYLPCPDSASGGDFLFRGFHAVFLPQGGSCKFHFPDPFCRMGRYPDQAAVIHQASGNTLTDPLGGICRKPEIQGIVEFLRCSQQTDHRRGRREYPETEWRRLRPDYSYGFWYPGLHWGRSWRYGQTGYGCRDRRHS